MLGLTLLIIAITTYSGEHKRWSLLLFVLLSMNGLGLFNEALLGYKSHDLALVYSIIINIYSFYYERHEYNEYPWVNKSIWYLLIFLLISASYSYFHYHFSFFQIIQGGRGLFLFTCYFFIRKTHPDDIKWIVKALLYISLIHAVFFVIQVLTGLPILQPGEAHIEEATGIRRYYNYPTLIPFFLCMLIMFKQDFPLAVSSFGLIILVIALFLTQGRTYILSTIAALLLVILLAGNISKLVYSIIIIIILILPFTEMLFSRFENKGETNSDMATVFSGQFIRDVEQNDFSKSGTLTYRFSWVYERAIYLSKRPLGENLMGLGMISDSQTDIVYQKYHFVLGLPNEKNGKPTQLSTPDISWGNILTQFGYMGGYFLILLWFKCFYCIFYERRKHPILTCAVAFYIIVIICSFSSSHISETGNLAFPLLLLALTANTN